MLKPENFFDLAGNPFASLFSNVDYVWDALKHLKEYISSSIKPNAAPLRKDGELLHRTRILYRGEILESGFEISLDQGIVVVTRKGAPLKGASVIYAGAALMDDNIEIGEDCVIEPGALIKGPAVIGDRTEVRQGAYLRGQTLVGKECVVGHATELKHSVMLGGSKAGHFAYIGNSLLGRVNLGAGTKLANLKIIEGDVILRIHDQKYITGLKKFGAVLGDGVETGCNSVTAPGTLLGKNVLVYPNANVRGYHPDNTIIKIKQNQKTSITEL